MILIYCSSSDKQAVFICFCLFLFIKSLFIYIKIYRQTKHFNGFICLSCINTDFISIKRKKKLKYLV